MSITKLRKKLHIITFPKPTFSHYLKQLQHQITKPLLKKQRKEKTKPALAVLVRQSSSNLPLIRP